MGQGVCLDILDHIGIGNHWEIPDGPMEKQINDLVFIKKTPILFLLLEFCWAYSTHVFFFPGGTLCLFVCVFSWV